MKPTVNSWNKDHLSKPDLINIFKIQVDGHNGAILLLVLWRRTCIIQYIAIVCSLEFFAALNT